MPPTRLPSLLCRSPALRGAVGCLASLVLPSCLADLDPSLLEEPPASGCAQGSPDGILSSNEECDDGNVIEGDGCTRGCKLSCDGLLDEETGTCYFLESPEWTVGDPNGNPCEDHGAHMLTLRGERETGLVAAWLDEGPYDTALAGLLVLDEKELGEWWALAQDEPGWSADCPGCFASWKTGEPQPTTLNRLAVMTRSDGWQWSAGNALEPWGLVCERPRPGRPENLCRAPECDPGNTFEFEAATHTYRVRTTDQNVVNAEIDCREWGGNLVVFDSDEERQLVVRWGPEVRFWIGLTRAANTPWAWVDGVPESERPAFWSSTPIPSEALAATLAPKIAFDTYLIDAFAWWAPLPYVCRR